MEPAVDPNGSSGASLLQAFNLYSDRRRSPGPFLGRQMDQQRIGHGHCTVPIPASAQTNAPETIGEGRIDK
jgi:hypothetical protein